MRIELVLPTLEIGGMERMVASLACGLSKNGHDVGVTCLDGLGTLEGDLARHSVRVSLVRARTVLSNVVAPSLGAHFRTIRPDVVHTNSGAWGRAARAAMCVGVPRVVHTIHGRPDVDPWYDVLLKRWELLHTSQVVAVSDALAEDLCKRIGASASKVSVLHNGIDTSSFIADRESRTRMRAILGLSDSVVFGTIARLAPIKNQAALIDAFSQVQPEIPNSVLVFVGDGPLESELRARAAQTSAASRILFLGMQSDTASMYRALDFFVLPSLAEGTSMSLLEAMASEVPAIATPVGGNSHLLEGGKCGTLFVDCSVASIRDGLLRAVADPSRMKSLAERARERVLREFSLESMIAAYERIYCLHSG